MTNAKYFHGDGISVHANIIWAERDGGSAYYRTSKYAMKAGKFPADHPIAGNSPGASNDRSEMGFSDGLTKLREMGYWASCFPEGDGVTMSYPVGKTRPEAISDIEACLPLKIVGGA